jgi:uncharacterized protein GlcG (DUF336 family)
MIGGGLPVIINGDEVGGIGISGGTAEEDLVVTPGAIDYSLSKIEAAK